jgi:hypothetical protein
MPPLSVFNNTVFFVIPYSFLLCWPQLRLITESAQNPTESILEVLKGHYFKKQYVYLQMDPTNKKQILSLLQLDKNKLILYILHTHQYEERA